MAGRSLTAVLATGALALAACSADGGDADPPASDPSVAAATTPTTGPPSATTTTSSTTTPSSTTTTTVAPTTTVDPVESDIRAAYVSRYDGYWQCLRTPADCDTSYTVPESESALAIDSTRQQLMDQSLHVGDEDPGYFVIETVELGTDSTTAEVTACWYLSGVLYGAPIRPDDPAGPDNPETIVNNTPGSGRQLDRFALVGGTWRLSGSDLLGEALEVTNQCAAEG